MARSSGTIRTLGGDEGGTDEAGPWLQVWSPEGALLYATVSPSGSPLPTSRALALKSDDRIESIAAAGTTFRVVSRHGRISTQPVVIQVARSEAPMQQELRQLALILVLGLPLGIAIAGFGGYSLARLALAPVNRMADRAQLITAERLSDRLPVDHAEDELGRLASVFNQTPRPPRSVLRADASVHG